jgi:hypothetical protein
MSEAEALSELIGTVYDTAMDPELWPGVPERACGHLSCCCGTLGFLNFTDGAWTWTSTGATTPTTPSFTLTTTCT